MPELREFTCIPCRGDSPAVTETERQAMLLQIPEWQILEREGVPQLEREFKFKNFAQALAFTNQIGELAEAEGHHPVLKTEWGKVTITWWTHKIRNLHQNDFVMAAKSDHLYHKLENR